MHAPCLRTERGDVRSIHPKNLESLPIPSSWPFHRIDKCRPSSGWSNRTHKHPKSIQSSSKGARAPQQSRDGDLSVQPRSNQPVSPSLHSYSSRSPRSPLHVHTRYPSSHPHPLIEARLAHCALYSLYHQHHLSQRPLISDLSKTDSNRRGGEISEPAGKTVGHVCQVGM